MKHKNMKIEKCEWSGCEGVYTTSCKEVFILECDTPKENGMNFCCFCGEVLAENPNEQP